MRMKGGMEVGLEKFEMDGNRLNVGCGLWKGEVVLCVFDKIVCGEDYKRGIGMYKFEGIGGERELSGD